MTLLKVQMNTDLLTDDLKKKRASNESFWLIGQPDVDCWTIKQGDRHGQVRGRGPRLRLLQHRRPARSNRATPRRSRCGCSTPITTAAACIPRQVFFPMAGEKDGWARLAKNLKAEIDEELIEAYRGTSRCRSQPGEHKRVAVKIVDDRGIESLRVLPLRSSSRDDEQDDRPPHHQLALRGAVAALDLPPRRPAASTSKEGRRPAGYVTATSEARRRSTIPASSFRWTRRTRSVRG